MKKKHEGKKKQQSAAFLGGGGGGLLSGLGASSVGGFVPCARGWRNGPGAGAPLRPARP